MRNDKAIMPILDAMDILNEIREWQYLLDCLEQALRSVYFDADPETRAKLTEVSTVLRAYDNEKVIEKLTTAFEALDCARKVL